MEFSLSNTISRKSPVVYIIYLFAIVSCCLFFLLVLSAPYGINLTDEGFALLAIKYPLGFISLFSNFGQIIHPFYLITGKNLVILRCLHVAFVYTASFFLVFCSITFGDKPLSILPMPMRSLALRVFFSLALSVLGLLGIWPFLTPSYASLTFDSLLILGLVIIVGAFDANQMCLRLLGSLVSGLVLFVILMSKITTGILLLIPFFLYCLVNSGKRFPCFCAAFVLSSALYIFNGVFRYGSLGNFIYELQSVSRVMNSFGSDYYSLESLSKALLPSLFFLIVLSFVSCAFVLLRGLRDFDRLTIVLLAEIISVSLLAYVSYLNPIWFHIEPQALRRLYELVLTSGFLLFSSIALFSRTRIFLAADFSSANISSLCFSKLASLRFLWVDPIFPKALFLAVLPFVLAFGTANSMYEYISHGSIFFLVSGLTVWRSQSAASGLAGLSHSYFSLVFLLFLLPVVFLTVFDTFIANPYDRNSILNEPHVYQLKSMPLLKVDRQTFALSSKLEGIARRFQGETPLKFTDLSTVSPGLLYLNNYQPLGWPWILGSTDGSSKVAKNILSRVPRRDLECSFVLLSYPSGKLNPEKVIKDLDLDLSGSSQYQLILEFKSTLPGRSKETTFKVFKPFDSRCAS